MADDIRSHWGWGWEKYFGDPDQRTMLGELVRSMLGLNPTKTTDPVPLDEIELEASRVTSPRALSGLLSDGIEKRIRHTYGSSFPEIWRGFHGEFEGAPDLVAHPDTERELAAIMDWAGDNAVAVVPYGGGTSVVQGVSPSPLNDRFQGWVSVDLSRFDEVGPVDMIDRRARIGAGVFGPALEEELAKEGMTLRHYPQSFEFSTLGGWLATRAGGHFATNHTRIDHFVESIRLVSPAGIWETNEVPSTGAGPDPMNLILGSEGILGFITSAVMKVRQRPTFRSKANVLFQNVDDGIEACRNIAQSYLFPSNCRLLDGREAMFNGVVSEPTPVLLLGFENADRPVEHSLQQALSIALEAGGQCPEGPKHRRSDDDDGAHRRWKQAFLEAPYLQGRLLSVGIVADTFETSIRWSQFAAFHTDLKKTLEEAMDLFGGGALTLRFTHVYPDGPAPYYTFLMAPDADETLDAWQTVRFAAADVIARHGATITHHHAVGRLHRPWYQKQRSPLFVDALRAVKTRVDPAGILNPGVLLDPR